MIKKKLFKILSVISAFILIFCSFCFSASAAEIPSPSDITKYGVTGFNNYYGNIDYYSSVFTLHDPFTDTSYISDFVNYSPVTAYNAFHVYFNFPTVFKNHQIITVSGSFCVNSNTTSIKIVFGGFANFELFDSSSCKKMYNELTNGFYYYVPFSFTFQVSELSLPKLNRIYFTYVGSGNLYNFGVNNINFESSVDVGGVVDSATKDIQANQDKNTDKILNGGKDSPGYSSVDKSTTDNYQSAEDEINNKTVSARSSTVSFFNNFGSLLNDTPVQRGLLAVSKIMTEFFNIGWFAGLIQFALGIGAFAFILGSVIMVVGKVSSRSNSRSDSRRKK